MPGNQSVQDWMGLERQGPPEPGTLVPPSQQPGGRPLACACADGSRESGCTSLPSELLIIHAGFSCTSLGMRNLQEAGLFSASVLDKTERFTGSLD